LEYTTDGVDALLDLAHGDMRRVINILQVGVLVVIDDRQQQWLMELLLENTYIRVQEPLLLETWNSF